MEDSNLEINAYIKLVKEVIEKRFSVRLNVDYQVDKANYLAFDLVSTSTRLFVQFMAKNHSLNIELVKEQYIGLSKALKSERIKLIYVFTYQLPSVEKSRYQGALQTSRENIFYVYDRDDILELAKKHGIDVNEYLSILDSKNQNQSSSSGPPPPSEFSEEPDKGNINKNNTEKYSDKIPFQLDLVENEDHLNREPIAKSLTRLLNDQIFKVANLDSEKESDDEKSKPENKKEYAFMMHLQGAWGDGKSTFLNLIRKHLNTGSNEWIVIDFNAWQHQHINPPWWPFLEQIYQQTYRKISFWKKRSLWFKEHWRRLIKYKGLPRLISFFLVLILVLFFLIFYPKIFGLIEKLNQSDANAKFLIEFVIAIGTMVGLFYSFANFISKPFFITSPESAKTFLQHAADPMYKIKKHFESLIDDIHNCEYRVAIFIDDLDRCNSQFTVELLEGIQTLFKDRLILYVVAGDKQWISTSFENQYKDYNRIITKDTQRLGYLFLEKAFQLSIRLPKINGNIKQSYWDYILQLTGNNIKENRILDDKKRKLIIEEIEDEYSQDDYISQEVINELKEKYDLDDEQTTDIVLEILDKDDEDFKHLLRNHTDLLDTNPRGIKRLANQYNMYRNTLVSERRDFDRDKLFRWIILQNKYPVFTDWVENNIKNIKEDLLLNNIIGDLPDAKKWKDSIENDIYWKKLIRDGDGDKGGVLKVRDIEIFVGDVVD